MYLAALDAIIHRLLGGNPKTVPPNYVMSPESDGVVGRLELPRGVQGHPAWMQGSVPVYLFNNDGNPTGVYPSFSVWCIGEEPRHGNYVAADVAGSSDDYKPALPGEAEVFDPATGQTFAGPALRRRRKVEYPYDFIIEVRAAALSMQMDAALGEWVHRVLPPRTYLYVAQKDGTHRVWDCTRDSERRLDARQAVIADPSLREQVKTWTYRVEGYVDNTDEGRLETTGRGRTLVTNTRSEQ